MNDIGDIGGSEGREMRGVVLRFAMTALLLSGCSQGSTPDVSTRETNSPKGELRNLSPDQVELDSIRLTAPAQWRKTEPGTTFVAAEFVLPRAEADNEDGRLTISTAGGSLETNIDRWKGQFDPQPQQASLEVVDVADVKITIVDLSGDFNDQRGPFAPAVKRPNYRMIAAVIPLEGQFSFIKATGPQKTIATHAGAIHAFIRSVRLKK
jgi:hypothetical protein